MHMSCKSSYNTLLIECWLNAKSNHAGTNFVTAIADGDGDIGEDGAVVLVPYGSPPMLHKHLTVVKRLQQRPPHHHRYKVTTLDGD